MRRRWSVVLVVLAFSSCKRAETGGEPVDVVPVAPSDAAVVETTTPAAGVVAFPATESDPREELTGRTYDVLLDGTVAYRATTAGVVVEDVSQPEAPQRLAVAELPGSVNRLALLGDVERPAAAIAAGPGSGDGGVPEAGGAAWRVLAAAAGPVGVVLYDIRDPAHPTELSRFDTPGAAMALAASYPNLYVADGTNGLLVLDARDPTRPAVRAAVDGSTLEAAATEAKESAGAPADGGAPAGPPPYFRDVLLDGDRLFAAAGPAGLYVFDASGFREGTPNPVLALRLAVDTPGDARAVAIDGDTAYVADGPVGLQVIDLNAPGAGVVTTWATRDVCRDVKISVGRDRTLFPPTAYLAVGDRGLEVLGITAPSAPEVRGRHEAPRPVNRVTIGPNGLVLLANDSAGLRILDAADPASIRVVFPKP